MSMVYREGGGVHETLAKQQLAAMKILSIPVTYWKMWISSFQLHTITIVYDTHIHYVTPYCDSARQSP